MKELIIIGGGPAGITAAGDGAKAALGVFKYLARH